MRFKGRRLTDAQVEAVAQSLGLVLIEDFGCPMYEQHLWDPAEPGSLNVYGCHLCSANYAEWIVGDRDWWRLPRRLRKLRLCTDCFARAVGFTPGRAAAQRFAGVAS